MVDAYREYLDPHVPADVAEVVRLAPEPVRAWLARPAEGEITWRMFLEGSLSTTDVEGIFEELVEQARAAGVEEFHVWSRKQGTYTQFSTVTVRIPD